MNDNIKEAIEKRGWMYVQNGSRGMMWFKFDSSGTVLARENESAWHADIGECLLEQGRKKVVENKDIVRVFRLLEYVGPRKWVEKCLKNRYIKDIRYIENDAWISESFLNNCPERVILEGISKEEET